MSNSNYEMFEEMFEKIHNSNFNELKVTYGENNKILHIIYVDTHKITVNIDNIEYYYLSDNEAKDITDFLKNEEIKEIKIEGFVIMNNIYKYPELFTLKVL